MGKYSQRPFLFVQIEDIESKMKYCDYDKEKDEELRKFKVEDNENSMQDLKNAESWKVKDHERGD